MRGAGDSFHEVLQVNFIPVLITLAVIEKVLPVSIPITQARMAYSNKIYLSQQSKFALYGAQGYLILKGYIFSYACSPKVKKGKICLNKIIRDFLALDRFTEVKIQYYVPSPELDMSAYSITLEIKLMIPSKSRKIVDVVKQFVQKFQKIYIAIDQTFVLEFQNIQYFLTIKKAIGSQDGKMFLSKGTKISCIAFQYQDIYLKSASITKRDIFDQHQFQQHKISETLQKQPEEKKMKCIEWINTRLNKIKQGKGQNILSEKDRGTVLQLFKKKLELQQLLPEKNQQPVDWQQILKLTEGFNYPEIQTIMTEVFSQVDENNFKQMRINSNPKLTMQVFANVIERKKQQKKIQDKNFK